MNVRCPVCANTYDFQRLKVLGEADQQVLTYIDCNSCGTALLSILMMSQAGVTAQGLVTDLTVDEVVASDDWRSLDADDVLNVHELLEQHEAKLLTQ